MRARCVASAAVWTRRAGGNDAVALIVTISTNLACFLLTLAPSLNTVSVAGGRAGPIAEPFRKIATWGGGSFLALAGADDIVRSILVLTLGPKHRAAIESLFGL